MSGFGSNRCTSLYVSGSGFHGSHRLVLRCAGTVKGFGIVLWSGCAKAQADECTFCEVGDITFIRSMI